MNIKIDEDIVAAMPDALKNACGSRGFKLGYPLDVDLSKLKRATIDEVVAHLKSNDAPKRTVSAIEAYVKMLDDPSDTKMSNLKMFQTAVTAVIRDAPKRWLYDLRASSASPFYVTQVSYDSGNARNQVPPSVQITAARLSLGTPSKRSWSFQTGDVRGKTVLGILAARGLSLETDDLRAEYEANEAKFKGLVKQVGLQCWASGVGSDSGIDGNGEDEDERRVSWFGETWSLSAGSSRSRVVIDKFFEYDKNASSRESIDASFWERNSRIVDDEYDDDDNASDEDNDVDAYADVVSPIDGEVVVFHLALHKRMRVHVTGLEVYEYDTTIGDKLVLPDEMKRLVQILIAHKSGKFVDIVRDKTGGAVVLLAGMPGTGKTLTAEVFAESEQRPLYNVQCSQLGLDPETLERRLLRVFQRASRWNAVVLLDEADVYVHERGKDLVQNAIVGVFLRVLEYHTSILFFTTNRPNDVDDAILSRCVAQLQYTAPSTEQQVRIWNVLSKTSGLKLADGCAEAIAAKHKQLSGRDVKGLLKLAAVIAGDTITVSDIEYAMQFRPSSSPGGLMKLKVDR